MVGVVASAAVAERCRATLIIPTFEESSFEEPLDALIAHLLEHPLGETEILVVDDSSESERARLRAVAEARSREGLCVRVIDGPRRGKGAAVRKAALASRGEVVFLMDADLLVPFQNIDAFTGLIERGADVVAGERPRGRYREAPARHVISRALYWIQTLMVFHTRKFEDTQCGFKAFRGPVLRELARLQIVDGGMFDLEYLYAATIMDLEIRRMPVEPKADTRPSRIDLLRCLRADPVDIARVKLRGLFGHYRARR